MPKGCIVGGFLKDQECVCVDGGDRGCVCAFQQTEEIQVRHPHSSFTSLRDYEHTHVRPD